jgi:hypothetical protein
MANLRNGFGNNNLQIVDDILHADLTDLADNGG